MLFVLRHLITLTDALKMYFYDAMDNKLMNIEENSYNNVQIQKA